LLRPQVGLGVLQHPDDLLPVPHTPRSCILAGPVLGEKVKTIGPETRSAAQDYIGPYGEDAKLLSESLEYVQRTGTQILNAIGADESSTPPA